MTDPKTALYADPFALAAADAHLDARAFARKRLRPILARESGPEDAARTRRAQTVLGGVMLVTGLGSFVSFAWALSTLGAIHPALGAIAALSFPIVTGGLWLLACVALWRPVLRPFLSVMARREIAKGRALSLVGARYGLTYQSSPLGEGERAQALAIVNEDRPLVAARALAAIHKTRTSSPLIADLQRLGLLASESAQLHLEDCFVGVHQGCALTIFEAKAPGDDEGRGGDQAKTAPSLRTLFVCVDLPRALAGVTVVSRNGGAFVGAAPDGLARVGSPSRAFHTRYAVTSTDQTEARFLLDPTVIEALIEADASWTAGADAPTPGSETGTPWAGDPALSLVFAGGRAIAAVTGPDRFEPFKPLEGAWDEERVVSVFADLDAAFTLAGALHRVATKERPTTRVTQARSQGASRSRKKPAPNEPETSAAAKSC